MCDFYFGTYECRGDGYVWDADMDGYDPDDISMPCPKCNTEEFLLSRKEDAETTSYFSSMGSKGSGVDIWTEGVAHAEFHNQVAARKALKRIKKVEALVDAENEDGYEIVEFTY